MVKHDNIHLQSTSQSVLDQEQWSFGQCQVYGRLPAAVAPEARLEGADQVLGDEDLYFILFRDTLTNINQLISDVKLVYIVNNL